MWVSAAFSGVPISGLVSAVLSEAAGSRFPAPPRLSQSGCRPQQAGTNFFFARVNTPSLVSAASLRPTSHHSGPSSPSTRIASKSRQPSSTPPPLPPPTPPRSTRPPTPRPPPHDRIAPPHRLAVLQYCPPAAPLQSPTSCIASIGLCSTQSQYSFISTTIANSNICDAPPSIAVRPHCETALAPPTRPAHHVRPRCRAAEHAASHRQCHERFECAAVDESELSTDCRSNATACCSSAERWDRERGSRRWRPTESSSAATTG